MNEQHIGSSLDEFLEQEGLLEDALTLAAKRVVAHQIRQAMHHELGVLVVRVGHRSSVYRP